MNVLRTDASTIISGVTDQNLTTLLHSYLPSGMFTTGLIFVIASAILTIVTNLAASQGHKKLGVLLLLLSTCFIAFLSYADFKDTSYVEKSQGTFENIYNATINESTGIQRAILTNTKMYSERFKSTPSNENRIKYRTAFDSMLFNMNELKSVKVEQIDTLNNTLKLHVEYVKNYEKLTNTIQLYVVICLIFLALFRIDLKSNKPKQI